MTFRASTRRARWAGVAAAATLLVVACGDDSDDDAGDDLDPPPVTEAETDADAAEDGEAEPVEEEDAATGAAGDGTAEPVEADLTEAGTELAFGEPAVIPLDDDVVVSATVIEIEERDHDTLLDNGFDPDDLEEDVVAYFGQFEFELLEVPEGVSRVRATDNFRQLLADGGPGGVTMAVGADIDGCDTDAIVVDEEGDGPIQRCRLWAESSNNPPTQIAFRGDTDSPYDDNPIVWSE